MWLKSVLKRFSHILTDKQYLRLRYFQKYHKFPNFKDPKTYNEKVQWLKLYNRNPAYTTMVDKYDAKKYVADVIGEEYAVPIIGVWDRFEDIDFDLLPDKFVLKCTHDSGGLVVCRDKKQLDINSAKKKIEASLKNNYFWGGREWPYKNVKPRIIAEKFISDINDPCSKSTDDQSITCDELQKKHGLLDYKFMCFNGEVKAWFLDIGVIGENEGHAEHYFRNVYDREGNLLPVKETRDNYPLHVLLPHDLEKMIEIAEKLSKSFVHLRVDLYHLNNGDIKVGEMTFYHGSGLTNVFEPEDWNLTFGSWIDLNSISR